MSGDLRTFSCQNLRKEESSSLTMPFLPAEIHQLIIEFASYLTPYVKQRFEGSTDREVIELTNHIPQPLQEFTFVSRRQLAIFRLVSHRYHHFASPLFFQSLDISQHVDRLPCRGTVPFRRVSEFALCEHARDVRRLVIGVRGFTLEGICLKIESYYAGVTMVLPQLLKAFRRLERLTIVSPEVAHTIVINSPLSSRSCKFITHIVKHVFIEYLPFTEAHHPLGPIPSCRPAINQAPLMVESIVMDWQTKFSAEVGGIVRTDYQRFYRDRIYENVFFSFVAEARNVAHLCIRFGVRRALLLDALDYSALVNLKVLELGGVIVSMDHLKGLLGNTKGTLRAVDCQIVKLFAGDWEDVYALLKTFERLEYLFVDCCTYM